MGVWDQHCLVCGGPLFLYHAPDEEDKLAKYNRLKDNGIDWLEDLLFISNREERVTGGKMDSNVGGEYVKDDVVYHVHPIDFQESKDGEYGIIMHTNCFNCIKKHLHHEIRFADIARRLAEYDSTLSKHRYYPVAKKYFGQFAEITEVSDDDEYLYSDPMGDSELSQKNRDLIIKAWRPLVRRLKAHKPRPSPAESAAKYKRGTIRTGFDGELWRSSGGRWKKNKRA